MRLGRLGSRRSWAGIALTLLIAVGPAGAQDEDDEEYNEFGDTGLYLSALGVASWQVGDEEGYAETFLSGTQTRGEVDPSLGVDGRVGYRFDPEFAVEGGFTWMTDRDVESSLVAASNPNQVVGRNDFKTRSWAVTGHLKYYLLDTQIQPYLLAGGGWQEIRSNHRSGPNVADGSQREAGFVGKFAGGLDWYLSRDVATSFELGYLMGTGSIGDADQIFLSFGLTLRFYADD